MNGPDSSGIALNIERGQATDEELAALTAVLFALRAGRADTPGDRPAAGSRWWRHVDRYDAPISWQ
ncbi:acyl-CoA carboxylase subunit epsilon [Streptomyces sp. NPDC092952]|uniref:acyl-CoA carboxylase subunit epsilon n=1 Tax=Streptomyces sp. NPDC092952 TaxID=3366018 RepID=UPI00381658DE